MILSIMVKEITFWNGKLIYVIRNVSLIFYFKNLLSKRTPICDRCSLEILPCSAADFTRYKLFQKWFLCPLFVFGYS